MADEAEQPELIRFEEPNVVFCRMCGTHLALECHMTGLDHPDAPVVQIYDMVNIVLTDNCIILNNQARGPVSCQRCSILLGHIIIYMPPVVEGRRNLTEKFPKKFLIDKWKLLLRRGDDVVIDCYTLGHIHGDWRPSVHKFNLQHDGNFYQCRHCDTHIARMADQFLPELGLFQNVYNIHQGSLFITGHDHAINDGTIADMYCSGCYKKLGFINIALGSPWHGLILLDLDKMVLFTDRD